MNTEELLKQREEFLKSDIVEDISIKLLGTLKAGAAVKIYWNHREEPDEGYVFCLPYQDVDEFDCFIHVPQMDNSDGIGNGEPAWAHLYNILTNDQIEQILVIKDH